MTLSHGASTGLADKLEQAREDAERPLSREEVAEIITEVVMSMSGDLTPLDLKVYKELNGLAGFIQAARHEIAEIRPQEIGSEYIPTATDELDAVVMSTEEATGRILDSAEQLMTIAGEQEDAFQEKLTEIAMAIFEASNFQDVTGQRITKVVRTLKHIETKIDALIGVLGEEVERSKAEAHAEGEGNGKASDQDLLNGPQLPQNAIDQDEIDRLLASFD